MVKPNTIVHGPVLAELKKLPDESIDMVITSPPYWSLRDYGKATETIWDEKSGCQHQFGKPLIKRKTARRKDRYDKCLLGLPERFMLGMIEQGWLLRNKIIWHKLFP